MLTRTERPLTEDERLDLAARVVRAKGESAKALLKAGGAAVLVCGALAVLTRVASDAPTIVIVLFWSALWLAFTLWVGLPWRRLMRQQIPHLESGLRANRARVIRLQSSRVVEFEEEDDEGACYAFELNATSSVFVIGQEFYEDDDFPNSDFSMVEILGEDGRPIDAQLEKHGRKLQPEWVVPAQVKWTFEIPDHLEVVAAPLERLESGLRPAPTRS